jgi:hypothetical protein
MRIQFLKNTGKAILPKLSNQTIIVYKEGYNLPKIDNATIIEFQQYKNTFLNYNPENLVIVGLNRILSPQNRCDLVFEYLQTMTSNINKFSIDEEPFIGEPWRFWFHYSIAFGSFLNINYSYAVETEWKHWFYREKDSCLISVKELKDKIIETYSDLESLDFKYEFYDPDSSLIESYYQIKEMAFLKYNQPKQIINSMLKNINNLAQTDFDYNSYKVKKHYKLPNFGIYRFLVEENLRRKEIYNLIINNK